MRGEADRGKVSKPGGKALNGVIDKKKRVETLGSRRGRVISKDWN